LENTENMLGAVKANPLRRLFLTTVLLMAGLGLAAGLAGQARADDGARQRLAVLPFEIDDNSGEAGAPDRHDAMLRSVTRIVSEKIASDGLFEVVPEARVAKAVAAVDPGTYLRRCNGCELDIAKRAGADRVLIGWLFKMSSLVMSLHVVMKDAATGDIIYAKTFDFRGDNQKSWKRAADYMVSSLARAQGTH
jgi:Protein of unknown function (DUF2380)